MKHAKFHYICMTFFNNGHCHMVALQNYINSGYTFLTYEFINVSIMSKPVTIVAYKNLNGT